MVVFGVVGVGGGVVFWVFDVGCVLNLLGFVCVLG